MISTLLCSSTMNISDPLRHFASLYGRHNQLRPWVSSLRLPSSTSSSNGSCRCVDVSTENGKNRRPLTTTGVAAERVPIGRRRSISCHATNREANNNLPDTSKIMICFGKSSFHLAVKIATTLDAVLLAEPDESIIGRDTYIVHNICVDGDSDMAELAYLIRKCNDAKKITLILTDFSSKIHDFPALIRAREEINSSGVNRLVLDQATMAYIGFDPKDFDMPVYTIDSTSLFVEYLLISEGVNSPIVVSSDMQPGTVDAAELLRENLSEYRQTRTPSVSIDMNSNYGDFPYWKIRGDELILARKTITPIIYQYRIQTYGNEGIGDRAHVVRREGGGDSLFACATHAPICCPSEVEVLSNGLFDEVIVTDASYIPAKYHFWGLRILSVAPLFADVIKYIHKLK